MRNVVLYGTSALHALREIPRQSVQCIVCSPPYHGVRDFGDGAWSWSGGDPHCEHDREIEHEAAHPGQEPQRLATKGACVVGANVKTASCSKCGSWWGQLGQELTLGKYIRNLVDIFREAHRVLRDDGVLWVNMGDAYASRTKGKADGLREKNVCGLPWRLAFALQDDGWWLRQDIIWHKTQAMPSSVKDRPSLAHEYIFVLTKRARYFYDSYAASERTTGNAKPNGVTRRHRNAAKDTKANASFVAAAPDVVDFRNLRSVWTFPPARYSGNHYAVFPRILPATCILASTSSHGACPSCFAPWRRLVERPQFGNAKSGTKYPRSMSAGGLARSRQAYRAEGREGPPPLMSIGWEPTCSCGRTDVVPCIVLDPFAGSGTTLEVAARLGRDFVGIEINREYEPQIEARVRPHMRRG